MRSAEMTRLAAPNALQLRITLADIDPPVWRRVIVPRRWTLNQLHLGIQAAFNWWDCHLHEFQIGDRRYGDADDDLDDDPDLSSDQDTRLEDVVLKQGDRFEYLYDFGDDWRHIVEVESLLRLDPAPRRASCLDGARARPPEDVGGVTGYRRFLEVMGNPRNKEHAETKMWCGGHFDPEWFDLSRINRDMKKALDPGFDRGLHQPRPKRRRTATAGDGG